MYASLKDRNLLFFSPARNSLPRHIHINFLPVRLIKQAGVSLWFHFNARRIIEKYHLDRVNIHSGPGGVLCARRLPVPVIVTCHHTYLQQISHIRSQFWKVIFLPFEKRTYQLADRIVAVSEATKDALVKRYGIPENRVTVIHNSVDTGRFHHLETAKTTHSLLYIGRIDKRKGIEFLIRSMPIVRDRIPDVQLLVGGKGSWLEKMKTLVGQLRLEGTVTFLGFVPDDQLNNLYNQVQCLVVPSVFEGFGITVIEALAAGTRVVGTDVDGIREILQDGEAGRRVPFGNQHALAEAIVAELQVPRRSGELPSKYRVEMFRNSYREVLEG
jgi:glycosyltransferase involved in cell wall biosynthesis